MSSSTRRGFIALSATGVAAGVVAATTTPAAAGEADLTADEGTGGASGPVVAYIHDAARGEVSVLRGEREVVVHDPALVRRLSRHL